MQQRNINTYITMTINPIEGGSSVLAESASRGQPGAVNVLKQSLEGQKSSVGAVLDSIQAITFDENGKVQSDQVGKNLNATA